MSRRLAAESALEVRRKKGWKYVTMSAYKVKPDPFWKSVRPVVPKDVIYGTYVTDKAYTTCFTGVGSVRWPRPRGRSGRVTAAATGCGLPSSRSSVGTANAGVPMKTRFMLGFPGLRSAV